MRTDYHLRERQIIHGDSVKHHPNNTSILVNILYRTLKYNCIKFKRKK